MMLDLLVIYYKMLIMECGWVAKTILESLHKSDHEFQEKLVSNGNLI